MSGLRRVLWCLGLALFCLSAVAETVAGSSSSAQGLYFIQQMLNALSLSCMYALLGLGYTLVYNIVGRINLAFGDMATIAAFATLSGVAWFTDERLLFATSVGLALLAALAYGAISGWLAERLVFRHLHHNHSQGPLVAAIGLSIVIQEYLRISQGADNQWLPSMAGEPVVLLRSDGFALSFTWLQLIILLLTLVVFVLLFLLMNRSAFGRHYRASSEDPHMAALCGIDVGRIVSWSFVLGTAFAGLSGYVGTVYYGLVNFYMGFGMGMKALTAVIVGGIGSIPGVLLGSLLIATVETLWSAYFLIEYRDIGVFALLIGFLMLRPEGLLGRR